MTAPCVQVEKIHELEQQWALTHNDIKYMKDKIEAIEHKVDNWFLSIEAKFDLFIDKVEAKLDKKADKWAEIAIKWAVWIIMGIVLSAMVYQVIIK
jgi:hypothetical protein